MINDKAKKKNPRTVELPKTALLSRILRCAEYVDDIILSPDFGKINLNMVAAKPQRREKRDERKELVVAATLLLNKKFGRAK